MLKSAHIIGSVLILLTVSNCGVQKASLEAETKAKQLSPPNGKALVYIIRPNSLGSAIKFKTDCDNKYIGTTGGKRFIYTIQDAGEHKFASHAENDDAIVITLEAEKIYYIEQVPMMGAVKARNKLIVLAENAGKERLKKCKLSVDCVEK